MRVEDALHAHAGHSGDGSRSAIDGEQFIIPLSSATAADAERIGPKAANLAALARAGLPTPGGFCLSADAYRAQIAALGLERRGRRATPAPTWSSSAGCRSRSGSASTSSRSRPHILEPLLAAWQSQRDGSGAPSAVRSSALIEDRKGANFAGQFESFLGIDDEAEFLTAVRACWAALWTTNARRYMENHDLYARPTPPWRC